MKGLGTIVNAAAILLGGGAGLLFHKGISEKLQERVMEALAFGVILIGLAGALKGEKTLVMILSLAVGAAIGALLSIDDAFHRLADKLSGKLVGPDRQAGFEVADHIRIGYSGSDKVKAVFEKYAQDIAGDTLADAVTNALSGYEKDWDVNGEAVRLSVERV